MKKIILGIFLALAFLCHAKTQRAVSYRYDYNGLTQEINMMINRGWKVVSMTSVIKPRGNSSITDYIIVIYEKEDY